MSTDHEIVDLQTIALPPFLERRDGEVHVSGHRITLENLCFYYNEGYSAEMLQGRFPTLPLVLIHKVIVFYLENREIVDHYLGGRQAVRDTNFEQWQETARNTPDVAELRRRLAAREKAGPEKS